MFFYFDRCRWFCSRVAEGRHLLLPLVKPELAGLAQFWLAALKDHALLTLPPGEYFILHFAMFYKFCAF